MCHLEVKGQCHWLWRTKAKVKDTRLHGNDVIIKDTKFQKKNQRRSETLHFTELNQTSRTLTFRELKHKMLQGL